ncbi:streptolysin associated protein SagD [Sphaerisporangium krabiense]|uniref:Thiazole/oxazole-forming peptide maturase SagD family component n=1 Tax=Sphaerisporangium krabiense TaxID=763782 RepID=A0A7W8Z7C1_9ACTN|nr:YcaO-like family protein [Sphaerisporangium krabiense]MBB5628721.1 thiazole/oxazole-forming peptide maturase SagD family component [Sphaerisporangium krabiense]GII60440.1 streptolysin associated protein SagD [Sphaerisporangium krabiense]
MGEVLDARLAEAPDQFTARLRARMHSPLCGLMTSMGFLQRQRGAPRLMVAGGELTGVHVLRGLPAPKIGAYHIGGYGLRPFEAHVRTLGEVVERYGGYIAPVSGRFPVRHASVNELRDAGELCDAGPAAPYTPEQYARPGFPFRPRRDDDVIGWVRATLLAGGADCWVPAQMLLVGYVVQDTRGEPWLSPAVSTGTASHTDPDRAALNALEEMVQIDAALSHWYGGSRSARITAGSRTAALQRVIQKSFDAKGDRPEFHLLPSADLPGFTVACLIRSPDGRLPAIAVGLGIDGVLERAMYRALLEAAGVRGLATWSALRQRFEQEPAAGEDIFDLESNVSFAAQPEGARVVERRFADCDEVSADDLPPDDERQAGVRVRELVRAFHATGKRLYAADFTTVDVAALGFVVARFWCPDLVTLPLPSAPAAAHERFAAYGGFRRHDPHPYP